MLEPEEGSRRSETWRGGDAMGHQSCMCARAPELDDEWAALMLEHDDLADTHSRLMQEGASGPTLAFHGRRLARHRLRLQAFVAKAAAMRGSSLRGGGYSDPDGNE
jgi:hypothetical protein